MCARWLCQVCKELGYNVQSPSFSVRWIVPNLQVVLSTASLKAHHKIIMQKMPDTSDYRLSLFLFIQIRIIK